MLRYANAITMSNKSNKVQRVKTPGEKKIENFTAKEKSGGGPKKEVFTDDTGFPGVQILTLGILSHLMMSPLHSDSGISQNVKIIVKRKAYAQKLSALKLSKKAHYCRGEKNQIFKISCYDLFVLYVKHTGQFELQKNILKGFLIPLKTF